jgi:hypothetical protein
MSVHQFPIQRQTTVLNLAYQTSATVATATGISVNGILRGIGVTVPALVSGHTVTLTITDDNGYAVFSKVAIAQGGKTTFLVDTNNNYFQIPLCGVNYTFTITSSGNEIANQIFNVDLLIERS